MHLFKTDEGTNMISTLGPNISSLVPTVSQTCLFVNMLARKHARSHRARKHACEVEAILPTR